SKTINVSGNLETPAILELTPSIDLIDLTINGLDEEAIILKNLKANKKLIVNGEEGTVTVDGVNKYSDTDMWGFPRLKPGANTITVSKNNVDITIKYKPRYI
ncbi:phage tail family protein, partial [Clostridium tertium]